MRVSRGDATFRAQASWEGNGELVQAFLDAEPEAVRGWAKRVRYGPFYDLVDLVNIRWLPKSACFMTRRVMVQE